MRLLGCESLQSACGRLSAYVAVRGFARLLRSCSVVECPTGAYRLLSQCIKVCRGVAGFVKLDGAVCKVLCRVTRRFSWVDAEPCFNS